jgi:flagellar basal-body rod modification protein FlgD
VPDVGAVGSATTQSSTSTSTTKGLASMDAADFMQILITQLQQQDPMNPMSNESMVNQMATIRDMEMSYTLTEALKQMTSEQRFAGAAGLIGKYVQGVVEDAEGEEVTLEGVVTGVRFSDSGKAILELDTGDVLPLEKLTQVTAVTADAGASTTEASLAQAAKTVGRSRTCSSGTCVNPLGLLANVALKNADGLNVGVSLG